MPEVNFTIAGRAYRLRCGAGQEEQLRRAAIALNARVQPLAAVTPGADDRHLLVIAALELLDQLQAAEASPADGPEASLRLETLEAENARLRAWAGDLAAKLEALATSLESSANDADRD